MKKQPILIKFDKEQSDFLKSKPNYSEYVRGLIKADQHRETRREYVWDILSEWLKKDGLIDSSPALASLLVESIIGVNVLPEIIERAEK